MKIKHFSKKLSLNKQTVAHLGQDAMKDARGGTFPTTGKTTETEPTWCTICQPTEGNTCPSNCDC